MTMDIPASHVEYLAATLETRPVTYHTMSRALGVHVANAKTTLSAYYNANKSRVSASFIATGTRRGALVVRIFENEAELAAHAEHFDSLHTVHIYCLSLSSASFTPTDVALEESRHKTDDREKFFELGLTRGPALEFWGPQPVVEAPKKEQRAEPSKPKKTEPAEQEAKESKEQPKLVYQSRKPAAKSSLLSNYVSRKGEKTESTTPAKRAASGNSYQYKSRKTEAQQPKERVVVGDNAEEDVEAEPPKPTVSSDLNNLFIDDFSDEDTGRDAEKDTEMADADKDAEKEQDADNQPIMVEHEEPEEPEEAPAKTKTPTVQDSLLDCIASRTSAPPTPEQQDAPPPETTVDDDGYFTSYKQAPKPEAAPKTAKARAPAPKAAAKKTDGKKKQASLMNFFQKR